MTSQTGSSLGFCRFFYSPFPVSFIQLGDFAIFTSINTNLNRMKKLTALFAGVLLAGSLASCSITSPVNATSNPVGTKVGTAKGNCWLGTLCFKVDNSIKTAAKNGGVTRIATVDHKTKIFPFGILIQYTTIVTGE